jgi:hypothetical protein
MWANQDLVPSKMAFDRGIGRKLRVTLKQKADMHPNHNFLVVRDLNPAHWIVICVLPHMHVKLWAFGMHLKLNFEICGPGLSGEDTGNIVDLGFYNSGALSLRFCIYKRFPMPVVGS